MELVFKIGCSQQQRDCFCTMEVKKQRYMRRALYLPTPKPLVDLCLSCKHVRCNGSKCSEYRRLEKEIRKRGKK